MLYSEIEGYGFRSLEENEKVEFEGIGPQKGTHWIMSYSPGARNRRYLPSSPFKPPPEEPPAGRFELDDLVTHEKYGLGRVVLVEGDVAVVVDFAPEKVRIMAPFARMIRL